MSEVVWASYVKKVATIYPSKMKNILVALFTLVNFISMAQSNYSIPAFKKGDQFQKQILTNSNYFLQLGNDSLDIKIKLLVIRLYTIDDVSEEGYSFTITTEKIVDTINTMGKEVCYNSEIMKDSNSLIEKAIKRLIESPVKIQVDKNGIIISASDNDSIQYFTDSLAAFTGLESEQLSEGDDLGLIADFPSNILNEKGYSWTDSASITDNKIITTYRIDSNTNAGTAIQFTTKVSERYLNSNINGVLMVDNHSGLILENLTQSVSVGYQFLNGSVYLLDKRSAVSESCYKK